jgi:S1-C subfamily serine protease
LPIRCSQFIATQCIATQDAKPRLGVYLGDDTGAAGVREVVAGSVAQGAGLMSGDRILAAAGLQIRSSDDLIAIVRRQSPGTWLPMTVERKGEKLELVAKFPAGDSASVGADTQHDSNRDTQEDN